MITLCVMYLNTCAQCVEFFALGDGVSFELGLTGDCLFLRRGGVIERVWAGEPSDVQAVWADFLQSLRSGKSVVALNLRTLGRADLEV